MDRALITQENPWWSFFWAGAALTAPDLAPVADADFQAAMITAVDEGLCSLRRFPTTLQELGVDGSLDEEEVCIGRLDESLGASVVPPDARCPREFLYWFNPYQRKACALNPWVVYQPASYLLPYWMGRYHGFIDEAM